MSPSPSKNRVSAAAPKVLAAGCLGLSGIIALPAAAAPPSNDLITSATPVTALPRVVDQDTTEATRSPDDGKRVGGHSVWYKYRSAVSGRVRVTTIGSDYDTVLSVFEGPRDNRELLKANDDRVGVSAALQFRAVAGQRYWVAASALGRGPGGNLHVVFHKPEPLSVTTVLAPTATSGGVSGRLLLSGTIESTNPASAYLIVEASQRVGANVARAYYEGEVLSLGPGASDWSFTLDSQTGWAFQPGNARVTWTEYTYDGFEYGDGVTQDSTVSVTDDPAGRR